MDHSKKINNNNSVSIFKITENNNNKRIDKFLTNKITDRSRNYIQKLLEMKGVLVNDKAVGKSYKLKTGDVVIIKNINLAEENIDVKPQEITLNIIYEDDYLIVISKQAGVVTHPAPGNYENTIVNAVLFYLNSKKENFNNHIRPGIIHRLDKDTSGLMIIAKNSIIQKKMSDAFKERKILKIYKALVYGNFKEKKGKIDFCLSRSDKDRKKISVSLNNGKEAVTEFKVEENFYNCTLLTVYPKTGRTHQIRVHFSYIGHPIIGDILYGNEKTRQIAEIIGLKRQFLHAYSISFSHPITDEIINLKDNLPDDLVQSLCNLRKLKF